MRTSLVFLAALLAVACSSNSEDGTDLQDAAVQDSFETELVADAAEINDLLDNEVQDIQPDLCVPSCEGLTCGPDGCGANCGTCGALQVCLDGVCCSPACEDKDCGPDGCGGNCGTCNDPTVCLDGVCCVPACEDKNCGPDGCGGNCGTCSGQTFCMNGVCSAPDMDFDGVPDSADLFPQDPDYPGVALKETVYGQTADTLYSMDVKLYQLTKVGDFVWPNDGLTHKMTDMGIDGYGVMYGTSYEYLYTCHPQTAVCHYVADLPEAFNGLTLVPAGLIEPDHDVLVGISEEGGWYRLDLQDGEITATKLGTYGPQYASAGDAYSILGVGTFAAVHKDGADSNWLVSVNPQTGAVIDEIGPIQSDTTSYTGIFGLAGWSDRAFAFDKNGDILLIKTGNAEVQVLHETEFKWWGAGVATKL